MIDCTEIFCQIDDFMSEFEPQMQSQLIAAGRKRKRERCLFLSEIMTLLVLSQVLHFRPFKAFYHHFARPFLMEAFPRLPSYSRFIELARDCLLPLFALLQSQQGTDTGLAFVDSTPLPVCKNQRIHPHRTFRQQAARGKTSTGWFYGFKLHVVINHLCEIIGLDLTPGNVDDRKPVEQMCRDRIRGLLVGDKGYVGRAFAERLEQMGIRLVTKARRNMQAAEQTGFEVAALRKRGIVETVFGQLKEEFELQHTRHRSVTGMLLNVLSALVAYCFKANKPRISGLDFNAPA